LVISYGYLWASEYREGREEGVKDRPCVIIVAVQDDGGKYVVTVAPVTHSPPPRPDAGVEIPLATKQRLGLDSDRSWVIVSEINGFLWPGPDLRPLPRDAARYDYGFIPPGLFRQILVRMRAQAADRQLRSVPRTE
jgi:hypothetical protein